MRRVSSSIFINAFLDLPQHVSANRCHHKGVSLFSQKPLKQTVWWMYMDYGPSVVEECNQACTMSSVPA
jgi:hypothetical protein